MLKHFVIHSLFVFAIYSDSWSKDFGQATCLCNGEVNINTPLKRAWVRESSDEIEENGVRYAQAKWGPYCVCKAKVEGLTTDQVQDEILRVVREDYSNEYATNKVQCYCVNEINLDNVSTADAHLVYNDRGSSYGYTEWNGDCGCRHEPRPSDAAQAKAEIAELINKSKSSDPKYKGKIEEETEANRVLKLTSSECSCGTRLKVTDTVRAGWFLDPEGIQEVNDETLQKVKWGPDCYCMGSNSSVTHEDIISEVQQHVADGFPFLYQKQDIICRCSKEMDIKKDSTDNVQRSVNDDKHHYASWATFCGCSFPLRVNGISRYRSEVARMMENLKQE